MSDDPVRTFLETDQGLLSFQHYFVQQQCTPRVRSISYVGAEDAQLSERFTSWLASEELSAVILSPRIRTSVSARSWQSQGCGKRSR